MNFIENLENNVKTTTENGAVAYATTGNKLLDFFYKVSSFRKNSVDYSLFDEAYHQDKAMTLRFLLISDSLHPIYPLNNSSLPSKKRSWFVEVVHQISDFI